MTTSEFSNQFDVLYNNITSNQAPGIDEYEKSIFLTKAQEELVRDYFNARTVKNGQGFDDNEKRQYDFSTLLNTAKIDTAMLSLVLKNLPLLDTRFDTRSVPCLAPSDLFLAINESILDSTGRRYSVLPIQYNEYARLMMKPYGFPLKRQAWRIMSNQAGDLMTYGGKVYTDKDGNTRTFIFRNKCTKKVIIQMRKSNSVVAPTVESSDENKVIIDFNIYSSNPFQWWSAYLKDEAALTAVGLNDYIYPPSGADDINGVFAGESLDDFIIYNNIELYPVGTTSVPMFEIIGRFTGDLDYTLRYVRTPKPIVLVKLSDIQEGLSINGVSDITQCELPINTHQEILQRAVELAKASFAGDVNTIIQAGNASGTDIGYTSSK